MKIMIQDLPNEEKPRERLIKHGSEKISNEELLAIILRCGTKNISSKALASKILSEFKSIKNLKNVNIHSLSKIKGIGTAKSTSLIAALELGKRVYQYKNDDNIIFDKTTKVYEYFKYEFNFKNQEKFYAVYLDKKKKLISYEMLFKGTVDGSVSHPREIFKEAVLLSSSYIICLHNHPSGDPNPSQEDINITHKLFELGHLMGIEVIDHIIIGKNKYYSFYEKMNNK